MKVDLPRPTKGQLFLLWAAGLAAITLTASGEYALYVACGFGTGWSAAGPVCIDAYVMAAIHARREVPFAVLVMTATNATAHLLPEAGPPVAVKVAVAALAPVVLWRVHGLAAGPVRQADGKLPDSGTLPGAGNRSDAAAVDEAAFEVDLQNLGAWSAPWDGEPWPVASSMVTAELGATPAALPVTTPVVPLVTTAPLPSPAGDHADHHGGNHPVAVEPVTMPEPAAVTTPAPAASPDVDAEDDDRHADAPGDHEPARPPVTTTGTDDEQRPDVDVTDAARALNEDAVKATGRPVTIAALQGEFGLSRRAATDLRRELVNASA